LAAHNVIADDRDEIVEHNDLAHARHGFRRGVVDVRDLAAEHRAGHQRGELGARRHRIDAVYRLAVDARLVLQIIDRHMGVVPGEARPDSETLGQFRHALLGKPGLRGFTAFPEINAAGATFAIQVVLSDQSFPGEATIDRRGRGASVHRLLLTALG